MTTQETTLQQFVSAIQKEYLFVDDLIQKSRNFIYSELKMVKYTNITLDKERLIFNQIINGIENEEMRSELVRVKHVFFQCIKEQMVQFQKVLARHMELTDYLSTKNPSVLKTKLFKQLTKQKDALLYYLLSQQDNNSDRNSSKNKSFGSIRDLIQGSNSPSSSSSLKAKKNFKTLPDSDGEDEDEGLSFKQSNRLYVY